MIKGSCDFYAIDAYTSFYAAEVEGGLEKCLANSSSPAFPECAGSASTAPDGFPIGPSADMGVSWLYSTPVGIRRFLKHITTVLFPTVSDIVVSEFGFGEPFEGEMTSTNMPLWDLRRVDYYRGYLDEILASRELDGVNVTGAFGWSVCECSSSFFQLPSHLYPFSPFPHFYLRSAFLASIFPRSLLFSPTNLYQSHNH